MSEKNKIKVDDKVEVLIDIFTFDGIINLKGKEGKVLFVEGSSNGVCVEFYEDIGGHNGNMNILTSGIVGKEGYCWWVMIKDSLKIIDTTTMITMIKEEI